MHEHLQYKRYANHVVAGAALRMLLMCYNATTITSDVNSTPLLIPVAAAVVTASVNAVATVKSQLAASARCCCYQQAILLLLVLVQHRCYFQ